MRAPANRPADAHAGQTLFRAETAEGRTRVEIRCGALQLSIDWFLSLRMRLADLVTSMQDGARFYDDKRPSHPTPLRHETDGVVLTPDVPYCHPGRMPLVRQLALP